jgi:hypothetical protein
MSGPTPREDPAEDFWADPTATHDLVAERYAAHFSDELAGKPFDRDLLTRFARSISHGEGEARRLYVWALSRA